MSTLEALEANASSAVKLLARRNALILRARGEGLSFGKIAEASGLTPAGVQHIERSARRNPEGRRGVGTVDGTARNLIPTRETRCIIDNPDQLC